MGNGKNITFAYSFRHLDGEVKELTLELDNETLSFINEENTQEPWAKRENKKCPNCTLDQQENEYCPVANNLSKVIEIFNNSNSAEKVEVTLRSEARNYTKETSVQSGLSSLIGIIMVSSGCPILDKLRPLVRYHLPMANLDETRFRVISMYLLAQYYRKENGLKPDWELSGLTKIYAEIGIANKFFCDRLATMENEDTSVNAVTILNCFANYIPFSLTEDLITNMDSSYKIFLQE